MPTIDVSNEVYSELKAEAARSHEGDIGSLVGSLVPYWQQLTDPLGLLRGSMDRSGERPEQQMIEELAKVGLVSTDTVARLSATFALAATGVHAARTGTAVDYLLPFLSWIGEDPGGRALLGTVVSLQAGNGSPGSERPGVVSMAHGYLQGNSTTIRGSLRQVFSDRSTAQGGWFDPSRPDQLGLEITVSPEKNDYSNVTLIAESWEGGQQVLRDTALQGGVLVGLGDAVGNQAPVAIYSVSLATTTVPG